MESVAAVSAAEFSPYGSDTRFAQERCFDEEQSKEKELAAAEGNGAFDQARKICSNLAACGGS